MQVASAPRWVTPPEYAKQRRIDVHKVLAFIKTDQLKAVNFATTTGGPPRYRISPEAIALFEASRSTAPQPRITRTRRKNPNVTEFF
jgi:hypothetical protein